METIKTQEVKHYRRDVLKPLEAWRPHWPNDHETENLLEKITAQLRSVFELNISGHLEKLLARLESSELRQTDPEYHRRTGTIPENGELQPAYLEKISACEICRRSDDFALIREESRIFDKKDKELVYMRRNLRQDCESAESGELKIRLPFDYYVATVAEERSWNWRNGEMPRKKELELFDWPAFRRDALISEHYRQGSGTKAREELEISIFIPFPSPYGAYNYSKITLQKHYQEDGQTLQGESLLLPCHDPEYLAMTMRDYSLPETIKRIHRKMEEIDAFADNIARG